MAHKLATATTSTRGGDALGSGVEYARAIDLVELPAAVQEAADRYDQVIGDRDRFLWKWIHNLFDEFTLSSVALDAADTVREQKTLLTIFVTTMDDLAEMKGDSATFNRARRIPFEPNPREGDAPDDVDQEAVEFLAELWSEIAGGLEEAPRYAEFADLFEYDVRQTINAMDYSRVLNDNPRGANRAEAERFDAYNMAMFPYACMDLMYSHSFERRELGALRSLLCELQQMARIGNWLTTWERELLEGDVSSGILVCALRRNVITQAEVSEPDEATAERLIDRIKSHGIESEFTREWEIRCRAARKRTAEVDSVDADAFVNGLETVMNHHLASDGYK
ncbi:hypothetical protein [Halorubrum kocurii]|uniref:Uncharacterized protein n=1 Tax=Halorubrum kocurii JCM 14978 TaxID=1230456 RepID=M0P5X3_9EURY|nr:hypothetical protein [Halorubrum kocurii]EMA64934.1 hypothetical protein C468_07612 [Halorubrum kocurii JCM 14978]